MQRKTARDYDPRVLKLFDGLVHGRISRREFLDKASTYAVGGVTAAALLESLLPNYALAQQIDPADARITNEYVEYDSPNGNGTVRAYLSKPADAIGPLPGVVVVHENRGLNPYIEDVARRLAVAGFVGLAPDGLTSLGGYPGNDEQGRDMQRQLDGDKLREDFFASFEHLYGRDDTTDRIAVVGFCYGGGIANAMAVRFPGLTAAAPFYGAQPAAEDVPKIQAALQLHYAGLDERLNEGWPAYEAALRENGKEYTAYFYADANHGFHNDTTPRYDQAAAELAWSRAIDFFSAKLV